MDVEPPEGPCGPGGPMGPGGPGSPGLPGGPGCDAERLSNARNSESEEVTIMEGKTQIHNEQMGFLCYVLVILNGHDWAHNL